MILRKKGRKHTFDQEKSKLEENKKENTTKKLSKKPRTRQKTRPRKKDLFFL